MSVGPTRGRRFASHRGLISGCAMLGTLMQVLDTTIANVALPYMQGSLAATPEQISWVLTSYIVAAAIATAPVGWLATRFGRKNLFLVCLAGFTTTSMMCGMAETLTQIVLFRILQGIFGAGLVPLSQATMLDLYPIEQRGMAMAIFGIGVMVGPILGPTLGGYLTDFYNWRWVFYVNLPFGLLAIAGLWVFMPDDDKNPGLGFDWIGFAALSLGVGALQLMLDRGQLKDWFGSGEIVIEATLAGLGLYLFLVHIVLAERPFIPAAMFRDRNFAAGLVIMFTVSMVLISTIALLAPYLQTLAGYPVAQAGLLMAPRGAGSMVAMIFAGRVMNRVDPRWIMFVGVLALAESMREMSLWTPDVSASALACSLALNGAGLGFVFTPLQVVAFATLPPNLRTDGTAFFSLMRNVGSSIGISVTMFLLERTTQVMHAQLAEHVSPFNRMLQSAAAYVLWNTASRKGLATLNAEVTRQASIIGFANDFYLMMLVCLPVALLLPLMRRTSTARPAPARPKPRP
jgi:MFS transporter, DHA2 family, multidrug resistance protein